MTRLAPYIASIMFLSFTQAAFAQGTLLPGQASCQYNCAQLQRVGGSLVATLFDRTGAAVRVVTHELDADAKQIGHVTGNNNKNAQAAPSNTGSVQTTTTTFRTSTQVIIVTTTYVHDSQGDLIDVRVFEARYPRAQFEK